MVWYLNNSRMEVIRVYLLYLSDSLGINLDLHLKGKSTKVKLLVSADLEHYADGMQHSSSQQVVAGSQHPLEPQQFVPRGQHPAPVKYQDSKLNLGNKSNQCLAKSDVRLHTLGRSIEFLRRSVLGLDSTL